ncbi:protein bric-a-brac 1 isoform X1 [Cephus cinctus]|uniref:Protein bric-a-brac 1 isoform X1 n=1 Tax=Cephus cinctus TaxID=211228 RepID=A0AAJ7CH10_CEPCN|nr:protein bric-a-brac 1 isoform X1 [Cephus cinctus]
MSSQICLKWNSFLSNIATSFESLWEEEGLVDVTLASDGQCLTAHKVILSASSPFFKKVFQTNPCQHPVIILQDVHFSELEALLIFIYKGEVNIEQKNLPALLKAAETLQIRGLSGGDVFAKESYKRLAQLEQAESQDSVLVHEETPKKKQKIGKLQNNSILEKALTPQISQSESTSESTANEQNFKDSDLSEPLPSPIYHRLEMKMEPFDIPVEEFEKDSSPAKDLAKRLDTGQTECTQGSSKPTVTVIPEARDTSGPSSALPTQRSDKVEHSCDGSHAEIHPRGLKESPGSPVDTSKMDAEKRSDFPEGHSLSSESNPGISQESFPSFTNTGISEFPECSQSLKGAPAAYPPFPCPFCDRAYTSWGFRRRHIKAVHTISPSLNCKWCLQVLPSHAAWRRHVISAHNLSASDAHNGLLILEEAHMVLQIAHPTRLDTLVNIIKQSSQQNSGQDNA